MIGHGLKIMAESISDERRVGLLRCANVFLKFSAPQGHVAKLVDVDSKVGKAAVEIEKIAHKGGCQIRCLDYYPLQPTMNQRYDWHEAKGVCLRVLVCRLAELRANAGDLRGKGTSQGPRPLALAQVILQPS